MEDFIEESEERAGKFAVLLLDDVPSSIQQELCGELSWDLKLDRAPTAPGATERSANAGAGQDNRPKKKHKSQRRMEKEKEYYERHRRMEENQKAKADALKKTPCKFFQMGKCKEGANCRFGHF